jgi:hypothetical protein
MASTTMNADPDTEQDEPTGPTLTPLDFAEYNYTPGKFAPWPCSADPVFGPDELGEFISGVEQMCEGVSRCDSAARIWEVLQAWELRLFRRNYQFLTSNLKGWGLSGGGSGNSPQTIAQYGNAAKLFSCNVLGARHKKITSLLSRSVPGTTVGPVDDEDPIDQAGSEEAEKYLEVFLHQANLKSQMTKCNGYYCTDGRVGFLMYTMADQTRWGTELPNRKQETYGEPEADGVSPETELDSETGQDGISSEVRDNDNGGLDSVQGAEDDNGEQSEGEIQGQSNGVSMDDESMGSEQPARREVIQVGGKLEWKVPLMADEEEEMGWARYSHEVSKNMLKAKYPWVAKKIASGAESSTDQIDRLARVNVRLAVQASSTSGEAHKNNATETVTFFLPSEYEGINDDDVRALYYETFPDGLEVWHAGGTIAMVRNCRKSAHVKIVHPSPGDGQNREALLTNYLPLQKVLNANISLADRYFRSGIGRRYVREPYISSQAVNQQANDPAKVTPVYLDDASPLKIPDLFGTEQTNQPNGSLFEFINWLIDGGPEAMDGISPAAFGATDGEADQGVFKTTRLRRDQALQTLSMPWAASCEAVVAVSQQAIESAAINRVADINASLPGNKKLKIELSKLQGNVLVQPESLEIPQTLAEQEEVQSELLSQSGNVALYQQIMMDPRNLSVFSKFPSLMKLNIPNADQVEAQQGEFEILMRSGPVPNPQIAQMTQQLQAITQHIQQGQTDPEAQTPEGQQAMQQLQQQAQQLQQQLQQIQQSAPLASTVPVAEDNSENHAIHAAITLGMLTSPTGRKLKNGTPDQQQTWQNIKLHWSSHMDMLKKLQPPKEMDSKISVTVDPSKFPPAAQAEMFQAMGLEVPPFSLQPQEAEHEVVTEKEGVDANGVPVKTKVSMVGKPLS